MIRRIIAVVLAVASVAIIAHIQGEGLGVPVDPDPIYYLLPDR